MTDTCRLLSVMPSDDEDGLGPGAHGTEGAARHRKNTNKQTNYEHSDAHPAYTDEQYEAVQRYHYKLYVVCSILFSELIVQPVKSCLSVLIRLWIFSPDKFPFTWKIPRTKPSDIPFQIFHYFSGTPPGKF